MVVPTATTRRRSARARFTASATAGGITIRSAGSAWSSILSVLIGRNVPGPTWSVSWCSSTPRRWISSSRGGVKWSPAVGAAIDPGGRGVDRLVALEILRGRRGEPRDIGRQWRPAVDAQQFVDGAVERLDDTRSIGLDAEDTEPGAPRHQLHALAAPTPRPRERPPAVPVDRFDEEELDLASGDVTRQHPRRDHA